MIRARGLSDAKCNIAARDAAPGNREPRFAWTVCFSRKESCVVLDFKSEAERIGMSCALCLPTGLCNAHRFLAPGRTTGCS
eukprot:6281159-Pyramimonas_sp.AAC.1